MRIAICDDEKIWIDEIETCCKQYFEENHMEYEVDTYTDGRKLIDNAEAYELLLLDVEMPGTDGIMVKEEVIARNKEIRIIFISSYPDNMPEAFGERVMGFLIKPLKYDEFSRKMGQVINFMDKEKKFILYETLNDTKKLVLSRILYVKAEKRYSRFYMDDGSDVLIFKTINECECELGSEFMRCHKSWIINLRHVRLLKNYVVMSDGREIPIGRTLHDGIKKRYTEYMCGEGVIWIL